MFVSTQKVFEFFRAFDGIRPDGVVDEEELFVGTGMLADLKREGYTELDDIGALSRTFLPRDLGGAGLSPDGLIDGYADGVIDPEEVIALAELDGYAEDVSEEDFAIMKEITGLPGSDACDCGDDHGYIDEGHIDEGYIDLPPEDYYSELPPDEGYIELQSVSGNQFFNYQPAPTNGLPETYAV